MWPQLGPAASGCKDCSYRGVITTREKEEVVRRVEDMIKLDVENKKVSVTYPWTEDVRKLSDNIGQAVAFQSSVGKKLLKDKSLMEVYNTELKKVRGSRGFIEDNRRGA